MSFPKFRLSKHRKIETLLATVATVATRGRTESEQKENVASVARSRSPSLGSDPHIDAFIARRIAFVAGSSILAGDLFKAWVADCAEYGLEPGSQRKFSARIQRRIARDKNNGRPKYLGVHLKARSVPNLRVVSTN